MTDLNCRNCNKLVCEHCRGIQCDICLRWFHIKCTPLSVKEYNYFSKIDDLWIYLFCRSEIFPFHSLESHELVKLLSLNSNTDCLCSKKLLNLRLESLPSFDISTVINNDPKLSSVDIDLQLPSVSNFKYYTTHELHSNEDIQTSSGDKTFSALHFNVRSISANSDAFYQLLSDMNFSFSIIGLSETKIKVGMDPYLNTALPDYSFFVPANPI